MSMGGKQNFIDEYCEKIEDDFTAKQLRFLRGVMFEMFDKYDIEKYETENSNFNYAISSFLEAKRVEGRSNKSIKTYECILNKFQKNIEASLKEVTVFHIRKYFSQQKERGLKESTLSGERIILHGFFTWLLNEGMIKTNPIANFGAIKKPTILRLPFSQTDIEKIKSACDNPRDKAIVSFLLSTGCRVDEVCKLNKADINFAKNEAIVFGKGSKERRVFLDEVCEMYLKEYFASRDDANPALFVGLRIHDRLTPRGIQTLLKRIEKICGVEDIHPHRFRRTLATRLAKRGMDIQAIAAILGHSKVDTTMAYVTLDIEETHNNYNKFC